MRRTEFLLPLIAFLFFSSPAFAEEILGYDSASMNYSGGEGEVSTTDSENLDRYIEAMIGKSDVDNSGTISVEEEAYLELLLDTDFSPDVLSKQNEKQSDKLLSSPGAYLDYIEEMTGF